MPGSKRKMLLIEPPFYRLFKDTYSLDRYPFALGYLAGAIKENTGWDVLAYNSDFSSQSEGVKLGYMVHDGYYRYLDNLRDRTARVWEEVRSTISAYEPAVVGISAKSQNFASACVVAGLVKEFDGRIPVIVGGPHASMAGPATMKCTDIDIAAKGEGENTIVELLDAIESGKDLSDVKGIFYRKDGRIIENAPREFIKNLDILCFPNETAPEVLKDYEKYPVETFAHVFATRGCPYNCFFCGSREIWSRKVRFRSVENVIEEIRLLQEKGVGFIRFEDDTFGVTRPYLTSLCDALQRHCRGLRWSCEIHVKQVDEKIISAMKRAGCSAIYIGIESGNNEMLRLIRKNHTIERALSACEIIKKHGIELHAFFMVGFPQETEETLNDTITAIKKIKCDRVIYSIFTPYPGTEAFDFCKAKGLIGDDYDVSLYNHQSPANCFCINMTPERFREIVAELETLVDRKNSMGVFKLLLSRSTYWRIKQLGLYRSFRKGMGMLLGK